MTIAGYYLSSEGVVLGADSTASVSLKDGMHFFDFDQKLFEVGENGSLGLVTWGGSFGDKSIRTLIAELADRLVAAPVTSVEEAAQAFVKLAWPVYAADPLVAACVGLSRRPAFKSGAANSRSQDEEVQFENLRDGLVVGFCLGGYVLPSRKPEVAEIIFDPLEQEPAPTMVSKPGSSEWYGAPNVVGRLILGADPQLRELILSSKKWSGTEQDLDTLLQKCNLFHPALLPIRDAIDYVYSFIQCTIKGLKFSQLSQICGGPIEVAVVTTDRKFRWVRHKSWDSAINDGDSATLSHSCARNGH